MKVESKKKYNITKEHCQKLIKGVCSGCGGEVVPSETVDNGDNPTFWPGCLHCQIAGFGICADKLHFEVAREMIEQNDLIPYSFIEKSDWNYLEKQTAGLTHDIGRLDQLLQARRNLLKEGE